MTSQVACADLARNGENLELELKIGDISAFSTGGREFQIRKGYAATYYSVAIMRDGSFRHAGMGFRAHDGLYSFPQWAQRFLAKHGDAIKAGLRA